MLNFRDVKQIFIKAKKKKIKKEKNYFAEDQYG